MGKIEEMDGDVEEVVEDVSEETEGELEEEEQEVEGDIFDEDLNSAYDEVSDFNIGSTMLVTAPAVESWAGQNLEETISRERVEKDWGDDEEFADGGVYKPTESSSDVYGATGKDVYGAGGSDVYGASGGSDVYSGSGGGGTYDSGKDGAGYSAGSGNSGNMKSYDQLKDDRRGSRSMLEIAGFEDKGKKRERELRTDLRHKGNEAA